MTEEVVNQPEAAAPETVSHRGRKASQAPSELKFTNYVKAVLRNDDVELPSWMTVEILEVAGKFNIPVLKFSTTPFLTLNENSTEVHMVRLVSQGNKGLVTTENLQSWVLDGQKLAKVKASAE